jgi:hypothetical protein
VKRFADCRPLTPEERAALHAQAEAYRTHHVRRGNLPPVPWLRSFDALKVHLRHFEDEHRRVLEKMQRLMRENERLRAELAAATK